MLAITFPSISVLIGRLTSFLSHTRWSSQLMGLILANCMVNVSTLSFTFVICEVTLTMSISGLYAAGLVTSVCLLIIMVQLFLSGMVTRPYLPAGGFVSAIMTLL